VADDLHTRYRPLSFDEVLGHKEQVKSLQAVIKKGVTHSFLFVGPAGVGKTTLARIVANEIGCSEIREIDAATHTGIDAMREVTAALQYRAFGGGSKAVIIDECHRLSAAAWDSLLKILEEPPEHVYWMLCTTNSGKIPKTIKTRCVEYNLGIVNKDDIFDLLTLVNEAEGFKLDEDSLNHIARNADGSVRQALVNLSLCSSADSKAEVAKLLQKAEESSEVVELCRMLLSPQGRTWAKLMALVAKIEDEPESVRIIVLQYMSKVAMSATTDDKAGAVLEIMSSFSTPFNPSDKKAPLLLAIAEVVFRG